MVSGSRRAMLLLYEPLLIVHELTHKSTYPNHVILQLVWGLLAYVLIFHSCPLMSATTMTPQTTYRCEPRQLVAAIPITLSATLQHLDDLHEAFWRILYACASDLAAPAPSTTAGKKKLCESVDHRIQRLLAYAKQHQSVWKHVCTLDSSPNVAPNTDLGLWYGTQWWNPVHQLWATSCEQRMLCRFYKYFMDRVPQLKPQPVRTAEPL